MGVVAEAGPRSSASFLAALDTPRWEDVGALRGQGGAGVRAVLVGVRAVLVGEDGYMGGNGTRVGAEMGALVAEAVGVLGRLMGRGVVF